MRWPVAPLGEVVAINPRGESLAADDQVSFVGMAELDPDTATARPRETRTFSDVSKGYTVFRDRDVLAAKITPCWENGKVGQAQLDHAIGVGSTEFHVLRPADGVHDRYLLHFLRQASVRRAGERRMTGSAGQRRVPVAFLENLELPLPPIVEQRRIADILDRADALRAKRREAITLLNDLTRSIFQDTFGGTEHSWDEVKVDQVVDRSVGGIRTGPFGSQLLHGEFVDEGVAVLGIDNAVNNHFVWARQRYIKPEKYRQLQRYRVRAGDVLITIMGTCGRAAVVPDDVPLAINTKHLCCITLDRNLCLPEYLHAYFLQHPVAREYLERNAKGAIMSGLNMGIIREMPLQLPPVALQSLFAESLSKVAVIRGSVNASGQGTETLFDSLQQRAFAGQL
jgi:type I restriction enzyme S subunit